MLWRISRTYVAIVQPFIKNRTVFLSVAEKRAAGDVWRNVSRQSHICVSQYSIGSINSSAGEQTCSSSWNSDIAQLHREPADGSEVISTVM